MIDTPVFEATASGSQNSLCYSGECIVRDPGGKLTCQESRKERVDNGKVWVAGNGEFSF